ncbi:uncharacterized protein LOC144908606 isoform X2 [Branchiostoma floridae x Branchiostoma belcheri]
MADGCGEPWEPPDTSPGSIGHYEQACDVRFTFKTEGHGNQRRPRDSFSASELSVAERNDSPAGAPDGNTQVNVIYGICPTDHTSDSTDTDCTAKSAPKRPSIRLRFRWTIAAIGLCALVGALTVAVISQFHQGDDNTESILASITNQLEANGKALQDILLNIKTSKLRGDQPEQYMPVPNAYLTNDTSAWYIRGTVDHEQPPTTTVSIPEGYKTTQAPGPNAAAPLPLVAGYSARMGTCPGNTVLSLYADTITLQACAQRCTRYPDCVAFSYSSDNHRCYPKTKTCDKPLKGSSWNVFYDKKIYGPPQVDGYTAHRGICSGNNILSLIGTGSLQDCAQQCDGHPYCVAFVFHHTKAGMCFPKSSPCTGSSYPENFFYVKKTGVCKMRSTNINYHYRWDLPPVTTSTFRFEVKANGNIHIALSETGFNQNLYEVVIGGWQNQRSVIRRRMQGRIKVSANTPGIASAEEFRMFEIHWAPDGTISVSKVPDAPFMTWRDPNPIPIHQVGYSTGWRSTGVWRFCSIDSAEQKPKGLWHFNKEFEAKDMTGNGNDGTAIRVYKAPSPNNQPMGSYRFTGMRTSRVLIPYKSAGSLDIRYSLTILAQVRTSVAGLFLYDFMSNSWGLFDYWNSKDTPQILVEPATTDPSTKGNRQSVENGKREWHRRFGRVSDKIRDIDGRGPYLFPNKWTYVGITYNYASGELALWRDSIKVARRMIGTRQHRARFPLVVGYNGNPARPFSGQISCLQLYDNALTQEQIAAARNKCEVYEESCGRDWHSHGSRCFRVFPAAVPYSGAKAMCARHNSGVALPKDLATNDFIVQLRNKVDHKLTTWIGLKDDEEEGKHVWEDGDILGTFQPWGFGEPNNAPGDADCIRLTPSSSILQPNKWKDYPCDRGSFGVVCEKGQVNSCPSGWTKLAPHCLRYVDRPATFEDAGKVCHNMGATLHTMSDTRGMLLVRSLARNGTARWIWSGKEEEGTDNEKCMSFLIPMKTTPVIPPMQRTLCTAAADTRAPSPAELSGSFWRSACALSSVLRWSCWPCVTEMLTTLSQHW